MSRIACHSGFLIGAAIVAFPAHARAPHGGASSDAPASAEYVVTNLNGDPALDDGVCDGDCSLREALDATNAHPGLDRIAFAIPGSGRVIVLQTDLLPHVTDPVTIDGENELTPRTRVVVEGNQLPQEDPDHPDGDCLYWLTQHARLPLFGKPGQNTALLYVDGAAASGTTIRNMELRISGNTPSAINALPTTLNYYAGPGTPKWSDVLHARDAGLVDVSGPCTGVTIDGSDDNVVTTSSFSGFLIGNAAIDVEGGNDNVVEKNEVVEANDGIEIDGGTGNTVAKNVVRAGLMIQSEGIGIFSSGNVIAQNDVSGAVLDISVSYGSSSNLVTGNYLHDGAAGIVLLARCGAWNNGNRVVGNLVTRTQNGIVASDLPVTPIGSCDPHPENVAGNTFLGNLVYDLVPYVYLADFQDHWSDVQVTAVPQGIDEGRSPAFDWPWADGPLAPPEYLQEFLQAFTHPPELDAAWVSNGALHVSGTISGAPGTTYELELFANDTAVAEAGLLLGHAVVTTDPVTGAATFDAELDDATVHDGYVTATATECADAGCTSWLGTSELGGPVAIP